MDVTWDDRMTVYKMSRNTDEDYGRRIKLICSRGSFFFIFPSPLPRLFSFKSFQHTVIFVTDFDSNVRKIQFSVQSHRLFICDMFSLFGVY